MSRRRRTVTTVERHELLVVRPRAGAPPARCPECPGEAGMVPPESAAILSGLKTRVIYRRVEAGLIHFAETPDGGLLVCLNSLLRWPRV